MAGLLGRLPLGLREEDHVPCRYGQENAVRGHDTESRSDQPVQIANARCAKWIANRSIDTVLSVRSRFLRIVSTLRRLQARRFSMATTRTAFPPPKASIDSRRQEVDAGAMCTAKAMIRPGEFRGASERYLRNRSCGQTNGRSAPRNSEFGRDIGTHS